MYCLIRILHIYTSDQCSVILSCGSVCDSACHFKKSATCYKQQSNINLCKFLVYAVNRGLIRSHTHLLNSHFRSQELNFQKLLSFFYSTFYYHSLICLFVSFKVLRESFLFILQVLLHLDISINCSL